MSKDERAPERGHVSPVSLEGRLCHGLVWQLGGTFGLNPIIMFKCINKIHNIFFKLYLC